MHRRRWKCFYFYLLLCWESLWLMSPPRIAISMRCVQQKRTLISFGHLVDIDKIDIAWNILWCDTPLYKTHAAPWASTLFFFFLREERVRATPENNNIAERELHLSSFITCEIFFTPQLAFALLEFIKTSHAAPHGPKQRAPVLIKKPFIFLHHWLQFFPVE